MNYRHLFILLLLPPLICTTNRNVRTPSDTTPSIVQQTACILSGVKNFPLLCETSEIIAEAYVVSQSNSVHHQQFATTTFKIDKTLKGKDLKKRHEIYYLRINLRMIQNPQDASIIGSRKSVDEGICPIKKTVKPGKKYFLFLRQDNNELRGFIPLGSPLRKSKRLSRSLQNHLCLSHGPSIKKVTVNSSGRISEGQLLRLKCRIRCGGHNNFSVSWFKNGAPVRSSKRIKIKLKSHGRDLQISTLVIRHVYSSDRGNYQCRASTGDKIAKLAVRIRVIKKKRLLKYFDSKKFLRGSSCPISSYCLNGGKCVYYRGLGELTCICATGFKGKRCEHKDLYDKAISLNKKMGLSIVCVLGVTHYPC